MISESTTRCTLIFIADVGRENPETIALLVTVSTVLRRSTKPDDSGVAGAGYGRNLFQKIR